MVIYIYMETNLSDTVASAVYGYTDESQENTSTAMQTTQ